MPNHDDTNRKLQERYGLANNGKANFRLVWSDSQTEKRFGEFEKWSGGIWLGVEKCVREVPKYPSFKGRWILENQVYAPAPDEVKDYNFYEPVFVFESAKGQYLEPLWPMIEVLVHSLFFPERKKLSLGQMQDANNSMHQKIKERDVMALEENRPTEMVLHNLGELVYNAYERKEPKNGRSRKSKNN